ncbi:MAG: alkaline phosphatase [Bacteroidetes bacterium GWF2_38_335]|nr:MAG: alkaline phosphatase [Bacteroidetes bacterium GWF2_38_335]OFY78830.1 MAG: alkaline phosphatase [Bacteroidetes bacterium RIFOXYA12_FULL_38_20]HBS85181.1 alkaline phosphatase [Bacteroidales bacterium]
MKLLLIPLILLYFSAFSQGDYKSFVNDKDNEYYQSQSFYPVKDFNIEAICKGTKAKNVILFIGDGMGTSQVYAALTANGGSLYMTSLKFSGFSKTNSGSDYVTDSGAGGTAIACGKKTYNYAIGVDMDTVPMVSILELAEKKGLSTGMVATAAITHATPASFMAHNRDRNNYEEIALDFLKTDIDIFIGGGRDHFASRKDKRNLLDELAKKGYQVCDSLNTSISKDKVAVFTASGHNPEAKYRKNMLPIATQKAIDLLSKNKNGFFLMVEGSQIDWGGHDNDLPQVIEETLDMDKALAVALEFAEKNGETLIIVTADHECGGLSLKNGSLEKGIVVAEFSTLDHTSVMVPVFAIGPGAEKFTGVYENTSIFDKMKVALGL